MRIRKILINLLLKLFRKFWLSLKRRRRDRRERRKKGLSGLRSLKLNEKKRYVLYW